MPQALHTIEEYIAVHRKKDSIWMVFNTRYNEIHALHQKPDDEDLMGFYDEHFTDEKARANFLVYMKEHFPEIELIEVFDLVGTGWLQWPYLGSIAINTDIDSNVYKALCEKYGDAYEDPRETNQALWVMPYETAKICHQKRCKYYNEFDDELGD